MSIDEVLKLAHAYADAKLMRYGMLNITNPPDPQAAFDALEAAVKLHHAEVLERCIKACKANAADKEPSFKAHEDNYLTGWLDASNECAWAIEDLLATEPQ